MTPCYYCDMRCIGICKTCIHSDTYEKPFQIKELSNDEIDRIEFVGYKLGEPITDEALRNFARAILRKAQEK